MRKWLPLLAICLGTFMLLIDVTIVAVALPAMAASLHGTFSGLQWVMDIYALALAALLLGAGSLADRLGRRAAYLAGLVLFAASSLACGLSTNAGMLIGFRAVQGLGAAAMFAATLALLSGAYSGRDRGIAFGVWGAVSGAAAAAGPILGGLLTEHLSWRWIFFVNLPICLVTVAATLRVVRESRNDHAARMDVPGLLSFTVAAAALTFALIRGGDEGWGSGVTVGTFAVAAVALAVFVLAELRSAHPMLDLGLFRNRTFSGLMGGGLLLQAAAFSYLMYSSLWLQSVRGMSPLATGAVMLPMCAAAFVVSLVSGRRLHDASPRLVIGIGLLLIGAGDLAQTAVGAGSSWTVLVPGLAVAGAGAGLALPLLSSAVMAAVPHTRAGMAGGAINTARQLGMALGIAVLGAVFQYSLLSAVRGSVPAAQTERTADALSGAQAPALLAHATPAQRPAVDHLVHTAFATALQNVVLAAGLMGALGGVMVLLVVRRPTPSPRRAAATAPAPAAPQPTPPEVNVRR